VKLDKIASGASQYICSGEEFDVVSLFKYLFNNDNQNDEKHQIFFTEIFSLFYEQNGWSEIKENVHLSTIGCNCNDIFNMVKYVMGKEELKINVCHRLIMEYKPVVKDLPETMKFAHALRYYFDQKRFRELFEFKEYATLMNQRININDKFFHELINYYDHLTKNT